MFTSIICTIIGIKFQINPLTVTLLSGSGPKSPPLPRAWQNLKLQQVIGLKYLLTLKLPYEIGDQTSDWYIHAIKQVPAHILYSFQELNDMKRYSWKHRVTEGCSCCNDWMKDMSSYFRLGVGSLIQFYLRLDMAKRICLNENYDWPSFGDHR